MTDENMWMSQQIMSQLFGVEENTVTYHIQEIYKSAELEETPTIFPTFPTFSTVFPTKMYHFSDAIN